MLGGGALPISYMCNASPRSNASPRMIRDDLSSIYAVLAEIGGLDQPTRSLRVKSTATHAPSKV